jgi:hypothetical protein
MTGRTSHLREAVRELEAAARQESAQLATGLVADTCCKEGERLGRALRQALPSSAYSLFVRVVREFIAEEIAKRPASRRESRARPVGEEQWLSRASWMAPSSKHEPAVGIRFADWLQDLYERDMAEKRLADDAEERRRREADQKFRSWQALRDAEAMHRWEEAASGTKAISQAPRGPKVRVEPSADPGRAKDVDAVLSRDQDAHDDVRTWPLHAEANHRRRIKRLQAAMEDQAVYLRAREHQKSNEDRRLRSAAAELHGLEAFRARRAQQASPKRIQ